MKAIFWRALLPALSFALAPSEHTAPDVDVSGMDASVAPGDDFFAYANGSWLQRNEIPADQSRYGAWNQTQELVETRLADLVQHPSCGAQSGHEARLMGDYYATFMDEVRIDSLGLRPLAPLLRTIDRISNPRELAQFLGRTLRADVDILNATRLYTDNLFGLWIAQDLDQPQSYAPFLLQGGLGMPDRSYYLDSSPRMAAIQAAYHTHVAAVLSFAGKADPVARAARIVALERQIAAVHWSREASEDVLKGDNHWRRAEFASRAPGLDWDAFFAAAELPRVQQDFVVWQPGAVTGIAALVASVPLSTWKDYLVVHAVQHRAQFLPGAVVAEDFAFHGTTLRGTPELRARWKRGIEATSEALGDAVGKCYAAKYFPAAAKASVADMVEHLRAAFSARIDALDWMAPETKASAKAKLATLKVGVGYPDRWRDYASLKIVPGDALGNFERSELFEYHHQLAKLGSAVDRSEWVTTPQTINAFNLPAMNAINFPAAVLQPPFFDFDGDLAHNYGAIGTIIGHEISHSFDDQGATFDAQGRLRNWWTAQDLAHFRAAGVRLVQQYDAYHPFPDLALNGQQTLSENIADVAGLSVAFDAYHEQAGASIASGLDGFTGAQRFFLSYAQNWREKYREPALRMIVLTNGHAPAEYRADTVRNLDAWYQAFDVRGGQRLYLAPADRVRIW